MEKYLHTWVTGAWVPATYGYTYTPVTYYAAGPTPLNATATAAAGYNYTYPVVANPKDKGRPVSSTPVPGTPWCVVWTGDSRSFFFNPSNKQSVWEKPAELVGRSDVAKMLESPDSAEELKKKQQEKVNFVL